MDGAVGGMSGMAGMQAGAEAAFNSATLDERTAHGECPEDVRGAMLFKLRSGVSAVSDNANRVFRREGAYNRYAAVHPVAYNRHAAVHPVAYNRHATVQGTLYHTTDISHENMHRFSSCLFKRFWLNIF